ncbi:MAG: DNA damage-inducible protein D [Pseudomonadota bacterium]|nr:DNA damage-inducible protein D [Pseudomonadota bacterium]
MKKDAIAKFHTAFEDIVRHHPDSGGEFWFARDLQANLGYAKWENFIKVVEKAKIACATSGHASEDHFLEVRKMVPLGSGAERNISDIALTRYACYLIAMNGDAAKEPIAFAQTYFAVQTRKQEVIEQRMAEAERLSARKKLTASEKQLSGIIYERVGDERGFARIRSHGDQALFGGMTTQRMKERLGVPDKRPLADFLPTITIKAKDFANEITNFNINKDDLRSEPAITQEHIKNNSDVRDVLIRRGIVPEALPAAEDIKKVERRLGSEAKKISKSVESLDPLPPGEEESPSS